MGIAVDVTHATDCPTIEKKEEGDIRLGLGPVVYRGPNMNHKVVQRLLDAAHAARDSLSTGRFGPGHADRREFDPGQPRAAWPRRWSAFPTATCTVPVEMISLDDIDHAADLLARFLEELPGDAEFIP